MQLITEVTEDCSFLFESDESGKKTHYIKGPFMQGGVKNRNGRVYPVSILEKELARYDKDFIKEKRALGELGHPTGPQINHDRASHLITKMYQDGNTFMGEARILDTPVGKIAKTLIDEGVKLGISTRGLGSVKPTNEGLMEVQDDFHLAACDIVADPSGPNCFVRGIMENTEYYYDIASGNWRVAEQLQETVKELKQEYKITAPRISEAKAMKIFENFIASLK